MVATFLENGTPTLVGDNLITIEFEQAFTYERFKTSYLKPDTKQKIDKTLQTIFGKTVSLKPVFKKRESKENNKNSIYQDDSVKNVQTTFDGSIVGIDSKEKP